MDYENIRKDKYTPQGYVETDDIIFITAYKKGFKSRLYFYKDGYFSYLELNNNHHVGGITVDTDKRIIFITGRGGSVTTYKYDLLLEDIINHDICGATKYTIENNIKFERQISTITYHEGYIYACTYGYGSKVYKISYDYSNDKIVQKEYDDTIYLKDGNCIQGLFIYDKYIITSISAYFLKSKLKIYSGNILLNEVTINKPGLEGIYIKNKIIYGIFEFGEYKLIDLVSIESLINNKEHKSSNNFMYKMIGKRVNKKRKVKNIYE
jgi:hypothetical protein